jgi:uracil-DNA glycosylase family 4
MANKTYAPQFKGYLPEPSFVMAKKSKNLKSTSEEVPAGEIPATESSPVSVRAFFEPIFENINDLVAIADGSPKAELVFVCDSESADLGAGGKLLDKMMDAMGTKRSEVYLARVVVKSRAEEPSPSDSASLSALMNAFAIFDQEFATVQTTKPKVVVALGKTAGAALLKSRAPFAVLRGKVHPYHQHKLIVTFHPDDLLKNIPAKKDCWEDLKIALHELGWKK